jgi:hypothetical protein
MTKSSFIKAGFLLLLIVVALGISGAQCIGLLTGGPEEEGPATGDLSGTVADTTTGSFIGGVPIKRV